MSNCKCGAEIKRLSAEGALKDTVIAAVRNLACTNNGRLVCGWDELCQSISDLDAASEAHK